jgi:hypothetical protein
MSVVARNSYDQEQVVKRTEIRDQVVAASAPEVVQIQQPVVPATDVVVTDAAPVVEQSLVRNEAVAIDRVTARRALLDRVTQAIWFVAGVLEAALAFRIAFQLLNANTTNAFVRLVNNVTDPFVRPFNGIFDNPTSGTAVLDSGALMAMFVYLFLAWALVRLVWLVFDRSETGARRIVRDEQTGIM